MTRALPLLVGGVVVWLALLIEVIVVTWADPLLGRGVVIGMAAEIFTGRESGIPTALAAGVPAWLVFQISFTQDIGSALLVYPVFLHLLHKHHDADNYVMRRVRAFEAAAQERRRRRRWGPVALGLFMLVPFLVNGPMVGLMVGRLAGLRTRIVLPTVIIATIIAAAMWTFFFDAMIGLGQQIHPQAGLMIAAAMVVIVVALAAWDWRRSLRSDE